MDDFDVFLHFLRLVDQVTQAVHCRVKELIVWQSVKQGREERGGAYLRSCHLASLQP